MVQENEREDVQCISCGLTIKYPKGHLTEEGKRKYLCHVCRESVLERRVEEKQIGNRKLLID